MQEAPLRRVYLRPLEDVLVPAHHSSGARRRAAQLQHFLRPLEQAARGALGLEGGLRLLVANHHDWRRLCSYPYGLPFTRTTRHLVSVMAAADYPLRLTRRFDDLLLRAGRGGVRPPGDVSEFLDLMIGHEWGHAAANRAGLRTRVKWFDELMATYLFAQALRASGGSAACDRLRAWSRLQVAATREERAPLDAFEYPRGKGRLPGLLWFQGVFTQRALDLGDARGWEFPLALRAALPAAHRGDVARSLVAVEPSFKPWFGVFAPGEPEPG